MIVLLIQINESIETEKKIFYTSVVCNNSLHRISEHTIELNILMRNNLKKSAYESKLGALR